MPICLFDKAYQAVNQYHNFCGHHNEKTLSVIAPHLFDCDAGSILLLLGGIPDGIPPPPELVFMCFSAEASFAGGAVISVIGAATLTKIKSPAQVPFGIIPLIFGIQQCAEGVLWLTLKSGNPGPLQDAGTYIFLITALAIWPLFVPLSVWLLENGKTRKKILTGLMITGGLVSLLYIYCLIFLNVHPEIQSFHIQYVNDYPGTLVLAAFILYLAATILPLFISSVKRMWVFGILIAVSCLVTGIFFAQYLTSVWCFFAALISIAIYWILGGLNGKPAQLPKEPRANSAL
jgi:hypothetical protein